MGMYYTTYLQAFIAAMANPASVVVKPHMDEHELAAMALGISDAKKDGLVETRAGFILAMGEVFAKSDTPE